MFAVLCGFVRAELINADGNVTLISGSMYYPVSCVSDGNILSRWATDAPGGYQSDYFETSPVPVVVLDLGSEVTISQVAFRGYGNSGPHNNSASEFSLRFGTDAEGPDNIGASIEYNPVFYPANFAQTVEQDFDFDELVSARYVEVAVIDNYFDPVRPAVGGDRVGFSEIQFGMTLLNKVSEPEPVSGAGDIETEIFLRWNTATIPDPAGIEPTVPNPDIIKHMVYLSNGGASDKEVFLVGEVLAGNPVEALGEYGPVRLDDNTTYYWRIDEYVSDSEILKGNLWSFTTKVEPEPCLVADLNDDCRVDFEDLSIFADQWLGDNFSRADFTGRDGVNLTDFSLLLSQWGEMGTRLVINEFMASNDTGLLDEDGMTSDWIEIYNPTPTAIGLDGWYLTDNEKNLDKWCFPAVSIGAGEYLLVFASGRNRAVAGSQLHTNFVLDIKGDHLGLVRPDGLTVESSFSIVPRQYEDVSFGWAIHAGREKIEGCYFLDPTPGEANGEPYANTGPKIRNVTHYPDRPVASEDMTVTAIIGEVDAPISSVKLIYRVMFGNNQNVGMFDDGLHGDGQADDGVYGGIIPGGVAGAGRMLRYYVETADSIGNENREPLALDASGVNQSPRYLGTVVLDQGTQSELPIMEWFTTSESGSHSRGGVRACVYYEGRFYDNIFVRQRGQATNNYSQKFNFNKASDFYVNEELDNVDEINMNAKGADAAYIRQTLAFNTHTWCGTPACESFMVYMKLNGSFDRVGVLIEQVDEDFLNRHGRNPDGALYKFIQRHGESTAAAEHIAYLPHTPCFSDTDNGLEKKTRQWEDFSDLQEVVDGLMAPTELERQRFVFDNFNLPEMMNYLAARAISNDCDDTRKNFYFYRDTSGTGEWEIFPWDNDFTFGIYGDGGTHRAHPFFGDEEHLKPSTKQWNVFFDVMFKLPKTREMYLRRLRTMMDELLQPPGTTSADSKYDAICDEMAGPLYAHLNLSISSVKSFFPGRRNELYNIYGPSGGEPLIPESQEGGTEFVVTSTIISGDPGGTLAYYHVPSDDSLGTQWTMPDFNGTWDSGYTGIGYERSPGSSVNYVSLIKTDVNALMSGKTSIYIRIPFEIDDPSAFDSLVLRMKYDDAFVAYINGNAVEPRLFSGVPRWDSSASGSRSDSECMIYEDIMLPGSWLIQGTNVLAIHGLNNGSSSSDLLILPELQGGVVTEIGGGLSQQLSLGTIKYNPSSGNQDEEYVEIVSGGDSAIDLSGWHLTGGVRFTFEPGTVIPSNGRMYVSPNVKAFRQRTVSPRGGQSRFVVGNYKGHLSSRGETITLADSNFATISTVTYTGNESSQQKFIRISEIMYHPSSGGSYNEEEYEYIELKNISSQNLLLDGVKFTEGVVYEFAQGENFYLAAGQYLVIVKNRDAFVSRYGSDNILLAPGSYTGSLSNSGERINFEDRTNSTILDFSYDDDWHEITDGEGFSLNVIGVDTTSYEDWGRRRMWRSSTFKDGTPGSDDSGPAPDSIVINELLAHSHDPDPSNPAPDWIELKNTTTSEIDISRWFMSDSNNDDPNRKKFEFPEGTTVPANGYLVLYQDQSFGNADAVGCHDPFGLSEGGETLFIYSGLDGEITGYYSAQQRFGASERGVPFGRYRKESLSNGYDFVAMASDTPGGDNTEPLLSDIVISEIMYNTSDDNSGGEYIELYNSGDTDIELMCWAQEQLSDDPQDVVSQYLPWVLTDAVEYTFPDNTTIGAGEYIIVAKDKDAFKLQYPIVEESKVFGPFEGKLNNGGDNVKLAIPGDKESNEDRYYIVAERVEYDNEFPWPIPADGAGPSLNRINSKQYANDPENWQAAEGTPGY